MNVKLKKDQGVTLIELLIALVISGVLIAAIYRTFIAHQKIYTVQEQVADMQQNTRIAIGRMIREIRMAGFGNVSDVLNLPSGVNGFTRVISGKDPGTPPNNNTITIVGGFTQVSTLGADVADTLHVTLASAADASQFDTGKKSFISIGGTESNTISSINGAILTLANPLKRLHKITDAQGNPLTVPIFKIQAITYTVGVSNGQPVLQRDENTSLQADPQAVADNIENLQLDYFAPGADPTIDPPMALPIVNPTGIASIRVTVTARTKDSDPEFRGGVGGEAGGRYRRRVIASNAQLRNMVLYQ